MNFYCICSLSFLCTCTCNLIPLWASEDILYELFHHGSLRDWTQTFMLGRKDLCLEPSFHQPVFSLLLSDSLSKFLISPFVVCACTHTHFLYFLQCYSVLHIKVLIMHYCEFTFPCKFPFVYFILSIILITVSVCITFFHSFFLFFLSLLLFSCLGFPNLCDDSYFPICVKILF